MATSHHQPDLSPYLFIPSSHHRYHILSFQTYLSNHRSSYVPWSPGSSPKKIKHFLGMTSDDQFQFFGFHYQPLSPNIRPNSQRVTVRRPVGIRAVKSAKFTRPQGAVAPSGSHSSGLTRFLFFFCRKAGKTVVKCYEYIPACLYIYIYITIYIYIIMYI